MSQRLILLLGLLAGSLQAQGLLRAWPDTAQVTLAPRGEGRLKLHLQVAPGWHTFPATPQLSPEGTGPAPLEASFPAESGLHVAGPLVTSAPKRAWDEGFRMEVSTLEGAAWVEVPLRADPGLATGEHTLRLTVNYQVCRDGGCRPPDVLEVPLTVKVDPGAPSRSSDLWAFLGLSLLTGAGALLTPCVFPMVPITVSFFLQRQDGRPLRDALWYGAGIVATFSGLGLLLALLLGASGLQAFATHPLVNVALFALFVAFALNLFGAFELALPAALLNRLGGRSAGQGPWSLLLMGLTFSLTSFTCTMPFVGTALVSASQGRWFHPLLGMVGFATTFALPFVLLALFPSALARLPKGGGWMARMKVQLGFVELAAALKFLSNADQVLGWGLLPRSLFLGAWAACAGLATLHLLGCFRMASDPDATGPGGFRILGAAVLGTLTITFASGLLGGTLGGWEAYLPPVASAPQVAGTPTPDGEWMEDLDQALARARREGKPLFLDFTGVTCTNCRWMERAMFPRPDVARALEGHIRVRLWTDRRREPDLSYRRLQQTRFGTVELPLYVRLDPDGKTLGTQAFTRDESTFITFLRGGR